MSASHSVRRWSARDRMHAVCAFVVPCALVLLAYAWPGERRMNEATECVERQGHEIEHRQPEAGRDPHCRSPK